jgi:hypothetical protein
MTNLAFAEFLDALVELKLPGAGGACEAEVGAARNKWCFPAGTLVGTLAGLRAIETIEQGDQVWAYDVVAGQWRGCRVLQTFCTMYEGNSVFVTVAGETIESTFRHP